MYPYDPRLKTAEELKATEFISKKVSDQIIKSILPDKKGKLTNQSWLIYGARGIGKSHILALLFHKIKEDEVLSQYWFPILCPEELFTVNSLYRLFKKFASLIISELEYQQNLSDCRKFQKEILEINNIRITGSTKQRKEKEYELTGQYLNALLKIQTKTGKKFIFFIENLQEVFGKQLAETDMKRLRDIFYQNSNFMLWIATAVQIPGKLADYGEPFYHFFRTRKLEGMNSEEIMRMLDKFCDYYNAVKLKKNLQQMKSDISVFGLLSGGNPRLIMLLYKFLENGDVKSIRDMMKIFVSDLTPYFQKETETLTQQQRLVIDVLCLHIFPLLAAKDIAETSNLPDEIVKAQLNKLKHTHWLRAEKVNHLKNELFILNEYIYRVWYQMRMGGVYRENIRWISEFLSFIYPQKRIQKKIGELENLISKKELENKEFIRSELEIYRSAFEWQQQESVKRYLDIFREKEEIRGKEIEEIIKLPINKKFEESLSLLEKSKDKIEEYKYYGIKGFIYYELGEKVKALELFSKAIELNPEDAAAYYNRGNSYAELKQYEKAIEDYSRAIALNPEDAAAYINRGNSYADLKQYEKAIKDYSRAIELNPEYTAAYYNRGNSYADLKQYEKAIADYSKAIELNPEDTAAYINRGNSYAVLKQYEKAIEDYDRAIEINPEFFQSYHNRGVSYFNSSKFYNGLKDFYWFVKKIDNVPRFIKPAFDLLFAKIKQDYKVPDSLQKLFIKGLTKKERLKHILILLYYKQNEIIRTYFSENGFQIIKEKESPYPVMISFTALFNLIESIKSANPKYEEFTEIWLEIIKNIEFEDSKQEENIFQKSLMLVYTFAIQDKESSEKTKNVLKQINKEYHPIAESHFYIPTALVDEKNPNVQRMKKDPIFKETVEKIKMQREM